jgi:hypothetical protein
MENTKHLLIVAPSLFCPVLVDYVRYKQQQMPTTLVKLEDILRESHGVDDPERLKYYLYDHWHQHKLNYVLLVGDADVLPVRYMVLDRVTPAAFDYAFYPSDLYYSDLAKADGSFESWNARKDSFHAGYFGEVRGEKNKTDPINFDQIDYRPEVAVGRWPVSTPEEVKTIADKTIAYEQGILHGSKPGLHQAALVTTGGWVDCRGLMDNLAKELAPQWGIEKRYYADSARDDKTPDPGEAQVIRLLNEGVGLLCHAGHGYDEGWADSFGMGGFSQVQNSDRLPVVISAGCSTARFATLPPYEPYMDINGVAHKGTDHGEVFQEPPPPPAPYQTGVYNATGLGEQLLRRSKNGAVAYIGCNTGSQPCGLTLLEGFVGAVSSRNRPRLGDCWSQAISYYYDHEHLATLTPNDDWYPPSIFFQGMKFMVFGDPTLILPGAVSAGKTATEIKQ